MGVHKDIKDGEEELRNLVGIFPQSNGMLFI
jgi:hypothetical protein